MSFVQLQPKELEPILIPTLINSSTYYTCDLCCDSSVCNTCVDMNKFLTTDCADCDTGSDMDISAKLLELECTNLIIVILDNTTLVSNV